MTAKNTDFYANKTILAPMVRGGRTPLRCLALDYGADLVYTEEIIDQKLLKTTRKENNLLQTVDYDLDDDAVLRIARTEASKCVLQVGTCSEENLVEVCKKFSGDVAAIDVNMGCPKSFSLSGGMGAALLSQPDLVKQMISSLVSVSPIPVSCKIRVLKTVPETLEFATMLEKCGISALGVHGRQKDERPRDNNRPEEIREVARALSIPVIASGESLSILTHEDIAKAREKCETSSIMLARAALAKPSIFRSEGLLSMEHEIGNFLDKACMFDETYGLTKYCVQRILGGSQTTDPRGKQTVAASTMLEICRVWGKEDVYTEWRDKFNRLSHKRPATNGDVADDGVYRKEVSFPPKRLRTSTNGTITPKCILNRYCAEKRVPMPTYEHSQHEKDKRFVGVVCVDGKRYASTVPQPNKKMAEQTAALSALYGLDIRDRLEGQWDA